MAGIVGWMRAQPDRGKALMRENPSYIFFRELTGAGPLGAMGVPVTAYASVATDPKFIPLGAPVWIDMDRDIADGLWVAQDTGGAIKGANRFDTFWGAGAAAESDCRRHVGQGSRAGADPERHRRLRGLSADEAALWARVTASIRPLSRDAPEA